MTGKKTDKAALFDVFYVELKTAPMIRECPVNMGMKRHDVLDFKTHDIFVGELVQILVKDDVHSEGVIDMARVKPLLFDMASTQYRALGTALGPCGGAGKTLKRQGGVKPNLRLTTIITLN